MIKLWIPLLITLFNLTAPIAQGLPHCDMLRLKHDIILKEKNNLKALIKLHQAQSQARELRDRLLNPLSTRETLLQEESIAAELAKEIQNINNQQKIEAVSIGALMLSTHLIRRLNLTTSGQTIKRRLLAQLLPKNRKLLRNSLNTTFVIGLSLSIWSGHEWYQSNKKQKTLTGIVARLNKLADLNDQIAETQEYIESLEVSFELETHHLQNKVDLEFHKGELKCHTR